MSLYYDEERSPKKNVSPSGFSSFCSQFLTFIFCSLGLSFTNGCDGARGYLDLIALESISQSQRSSTLISVLSETRTRFGCTSRDSLLRVLLSREKERGGFSPLSVLLRFLLFSLKDLSSFHPRAARRSSVFVILTNGARGGIIYRY